MIHMRIESTYFVAFKIALSHALEEHLSPRQTMTHRYPYKNTSRISLFAITHDYDYVKQLTNMFTIHINFEQQNKELNLAQLDRERINESGATSSPPCHKSDIGYDVRLHCIREFPIGNNHPNSRDSWWQRETLHSKYGKLSSLVSLMPFSWESWFVIMLYLFHTVLSESQLLTPATSFLISPTQLDGYKTAKWLQMARMDDND